MSIGWIFTRPDDIVSEACPPPLLLLLYEPIDVTDSLSQVGYCAACSMVEHHTNSTASWEPTLTYLPIGVMWLEA